VAVVGAHGAGTRRIGIVAIGRNEGERLERCLASMPADCAAVVYVDSGSTDDSVGRARAAGAEVVVLDPAVPFTAARARNEGIARLRAIAPGAALVQLVDGDCELVAGWLEAGLAAIDADETVAVVCGRRRERAPDESPYNQLCDMEWDTPVGEAEACGGDALMRLDALADVGGFEPGMIAGEEPELCLRLRRAGCKVLRVDHDMTIHDARMTRLSQWWTRNVRAGHACAEGHHRHGAGPERYKRHAVASNLVWGAVLPAASLGLAPVTLGGSLSLLGLYGVLYRRVRRHRVAHGDSPERASLYARYLVLGKVAQAQGVLRFHTDRWRHEGGKLIEYK